MEALASLVKNVTASPCDALRKMVSGLIDFQKWLNSESWALLKKGASLVAGLFSYLWNDLALPAWDAVKKFAASVWAWIEARAKEFWEWIAPLRRGISAVWNKVKQLIGVAWEKGNDVFDWLKQKLSSAWDRVKATLQPFMGPLKIIGGILLLLSPLGPILVIGAVGYGLFRAAQWLYNNWDHLEIVIQARKILHEQVIPWIHSAVLAVTGALHEAAKWLHEKVSALREALAQLSDALGVNTLLRFAKAAVDWIGAKINQFAAWVAGGFNKLVDAVSPTIQRIWDFFKPIGVVLAKLVLAITNPILLPIYLGAVVWLILPDCIKPPLIDYILDLMIAGIRGIPNWGFFGEEWPTIKEGVVRPLEEKRQKASPEEKIRFSNKIANMIAGPDLTGFSNLFQAAKRAPDQFMGQVEQELVGMDLTQPLPLERGPASGEGILAQQAAAGFGGGMMTPENLALLQKTTFSDGDVQADQVSRVQMHPQFFDSLELGPDGTAIFAENPNPTITSESLRGELAGLTTVGQSNAGLGGGRPAEGMERPPADLSVEEQIRWFVSHQPKQGCEPKGAPQSKVPTEAASPGMQIFPPLTQGQRALFVWEQMKSGLRQWYECHKTAVIASIIGALVLLVVLAVLTDGVIFEVLPQIMEVIGFIFIGVSVVRMSMFIADYVAKAVAGDISGAAKSLARGLAIGAIELLMYLLTAGTGKGATKAGEKAAQGTIEGAAQAGKRAPRPFMEAAADAGRRFLVNIKNPLGAFMRNGKAFIRGVEQGIERGVRSLRELGEKLLQKMGFRSFSAEVHGSWLFIYGIFNPKVLLAEIPLPIRTRFAATLAERPQLAGALVRLEDLTKFEGLLGRNHELLERLHDLQRAAESGHTAVQFSASVRNLEEEILDELATRVAKAVNSPVRDAEGLKAFIREHPERIGEFLDAAAGRLEATGTRGIPAGRVDIPTHIPGIPQHLYDALRSRTPSDEIRDAIRAALPQGVPDPALPSRLIAGPVHADHIVPMQKITQMRGFADLTEENMLRVLNFRDNFVALSEAANTSKGTRSFYEWMSYARGGIDVDAAFRKTMMFRELELEGTLENYIEQLLRQQVLPVVQRQAAGAASTRVLVSSDVVPLTSRGQALEGGTRKFMETALRAGFSSVRVHADALAAESANALGADAYTVGRDIYFASGKYAPASHEGRHLLAHELAHVVQQSKATIPQKKSAKAISGLVVSPTDPLEQEAERTAARVVSETSNGQFGVLPNPLQGEQENAFSAEYAVDGSSAEHRPRVEQGGGLISRQPEQVVQTRGEPGLIMLQRAPGGPGFDPDAPVADFPVFDPDAATTQHVEPSGPTNQPYIQVFVDGYLLTNSKEQLTELVDDLTIQYGQEAGAILRDRLGRALPMRPSSDSPLLIIFDLLKEVVDASQKRYHQFLGEFQWKAYWLTNEILAESTHAVIREMLRYGLDKLTAFGLPAPDAISKAEIDEVSQGAKLLMIKKQQLWEAWMAFEFPECPTCEPTGPAPGALERYQALTEQYDALHEHLETLYPILGRIGDLGESFFFSTWRQLKTEDPLYKLAFGDGIAQFIVLRDEADQRLDDIGKTRDGLDEDIDKVWKLPPVIESTRRSMHIPEGSLKHRLIQSEVKRRAEESFWTKIALGVIQLAGALLAPFTGGLSLSVTVGISASQAYESWVEYQFQKAAAGSDFSRARSISASDPSLFGLALDIVGVVFDVSGFGAELRGVAAAERLAAEQALLKQAEESFNEISPLVHEAQAAGTKETEDAIKAAAKKIDPKGALGERIIAQLKSGDVGGEALQKTVGLSAEELKPFLEARSVLRRDVELSEVAEDIVASAGNVHITGQGWIFVCHSPCTVLREVYGELLAADVSLFSRAERLENRAQRAISNLKQAEKSGNQAAKRAAQQENYEVARDASLFDSELRSYRTAERANVLDQIEKLRALLDGIPGIGQYGKSVMHELDTAAMERIMAVARKGKDPINAVKGQLFEEIMNLRIRDLRAASNLPVEFIPGWAIRGPRRELLTDGIVGMWVDGRFKVLKVFEAKSSARAAEDLIGRVTGYIKPERRLKLFEFAEKKGIGDALFKQNRQYTELLRESATKVRVEGKFRGLSLDNVLKQHPDEVWKVAEEESQIEAGQFRSTGERLQSAQEIYAYGQRIPIDYSPGSATFEGVVPSNLTSAQRSALYKGAEKIGFPTTTFTQLGMSEDEVREIANRIIESMKSAATP